MTKYEIEIVTTVYPDDALSVWQEGFFQKADVWIGRVTGFSDIREVLYQDPKYGYYTVASTKSPRQQWEDANGGTARFITDEAAAEWLKQNSTTCTTLEKKPGGLGEFNPIETIPC